MTDYVPGGGQSRSHDHTYRADWYRSIIRKHIAVGYYWQRHIELLVAVEEQDIAGLKFFSLNSVRPLLHKGNMSEKNNNVDNVKTCAIAGVALVAIGATTYVASKAIDNHCTCRVEVSPVKVSVTLGPSDTSNDGKKSIK